jgi:DNA-binding transcriptional MocR family regulator
MVTIGSRLIDTLETIGKVSCGDNPASEFNVLMTIWKPNLEKRRGPKYVALADAIADDVKAGRLTPGTRLPTHRDLAHDLGVTVGTITRAYAEAARRGLLAGEVGRGTFVADVENASRLLMRPHSPGHGTIDLSRNHPTVHLANSAMTKALDRLRHSEHFEDLLQYSPHSGTERHRDAGVGWLKLLGIPATRDEIVITCGAQHGILLAFSALARSGETVLAEALTYPGVRAVARFLDLKLEPLAMDEEGATPEAFENACRRLAPRAFYVVPTVQNPTGRCMSAERRKVIVQVARRYRVMLIEDDIYATYVDHAPTPLAALAPEMTLAVVGLSKCLAPSLRIGYLRAPSTVHPALVTGVMTTAHNASPLAAELASLALEDGSAEKLIARIRVDTAKRAAIARPKLEKWIAKGCRPASPHLWLDLPEPWRTTEFSAAALARGVAVAPSENFLVGRGTAPHGVRVSLSAPAKPADLERGVEILAQLLREAPQPELSGV